MTLEYRAFIPLGDIEGLEIICPHCNAEVFVPLDKMDRGVPGACSNCLEVIVADTHKNSSMESDYRLLGAFMMRLRDIRKRESSEHLRLRIKAPQSS